MKFLAQTAAWMIVAAVTFVTLGPPRYRPMTNLGQNGEHALAFVLVGLAVGLAYPNRPFLIAVTAVIFTGLVELLQFFAPGRHARWEDFFVDAATLLVGLAIAAAAQWLLRHRGPSVPAE